MNIVQNHNTFFFFFFFLQEEIQRVGKIDEDLQKLSVAVNRVSHYSVLPQGFSSLIYIEK